MHSNEDPHVAMKTQCSQKLITKNTYVLKSIYKRYMHIIVPLTKEDKISSISYCIVNTVINITYFNI